MSPDESSGFRQDTWGTVKYCVVVMAIVIILVKSRKKKTPQGAYWWWLWLWLVLLQLLQLLQLLWLCCCGCVWGFELAVTSGEEINYESCDLLRVGLSNLEKNYSKSFKPTLNKSHDSLISSLLVTANSKPQPQQQQQPSTTTTATTAATAVEPWQGAKEHSGKGQS